MEAFPSKAHFAQPRKRYRDGPHLQGREQAQTKRDFKGGNKSEMRFEHGRLEGRCFGGVASCTQVRR